MFIYQPHFDSIDRTIWYGGESTQLHYEELDDSGNWIKQAVHTFCRGIPSGMSEIHAELIDFYNYCNAASI